MKARASLSKSLAACVITFACSTFVIAAERGLPEQFNLIKQSVLQTVAESQKIGAAQTYHLLKENLAAFRSLSNRVQQAPHMDSIIEELATELDTIAGNFEKAANLRVEYGNHTEASRAEMTRRHKETQMAIAEIDSRIKATQDELHQALTSHPATALEQDKNRITISSNLSVLNSLTAQRQIWVKFADSQSRLMSTFSASTERVDFVLFVLQKNAQVYREAANAAQLRRNVRLALQDLHALGAIENSLIDLAASWREVDEIVSEIGREEFLTYAGS